MATLSIHKAGRSSGEIFAGKIISCTAESD